MPSANWLEVFKTGTHTSGAGITKTYTEEDLDKMAIAYNGQKDHVAPLVIGHPKTDDPAFGWAQSLKRVGDKLLAYVDQVSDDVTEAVKAGSYKKVSIALYPDGLLRHIGLLGAMPPAVKGLAPVQFAEGEEFEEYVWATDEWRMPVVARILSNVRDFFIEKFGLEPADKMIGKDDIETLRTPIKSVMLTISDKKEITAPENILVPPVGAITNNYNEENQQEVEEMEIKEIKEQFDEFAKTVVTATEFSEFKKIVTDFITLTTDKFKKEEDDSAKSTLDTAKLTFAENLDGLIKEGKVLPAEKDGLIDEYADILRVEEGMTFAEGEERLSVKMKARLAARPVLIQPNRERFATHKKVSGEKSKIDVPAEFSEVSNIDEGSLAIDSLIKSYMAEHKCSYEEAAEKISAS